jgi:hypothetical protein
VAIGPPRYGFIMRPKTPVDRDRSLTVSGVPEALAAWVTRLP